MGALSGLKVVEFAGIGPGPFCCMLLADMGAEVLRIDRTSVVGRDPMEPRFNTTLRSRRNLAIDLKHKDGVTTALALCDKADILIEGFRPGVMERLGLGPDLILARNPKIVYGRMTGWGQDGPLANAAGHDINYIALTGALYAIGTDAGGPVPPLNLIGDFGGGALYMAMGVLAAYIEAQRSGAGQVVDCAMVEGAASLMTPAFGQLAAGNFIEQRESNRLDGGCHHYNVYETKDGEHVCIGSNEPQFYALLLEKLGLVDADIPEQTDRTGWAKNRQTLAKIFKTRSRQEWREVMEGSDVCFAPVLRMSEAPVHPHNEARQNFITLDEVLQPAPAPRFSRTASRADRAPAFAGEHTRDILNDWGFSPERIDSLLNGGAVKQLDR